MFRDRFDRVSKNILVEKPVNYQHSLIFLSEPLQPIKPDQQEDRRCN